MEANRRFGMRITDEDSEFLAKRAEEEGLTRTDYMRLLPKTSVEVSSGKSIADQDVFVLDRMTAANMAYQMRMLGQHYNRAVRVQSPGILYGEGFCKPRRRGRLIREGLEGAGGS